MLGLDQPRLRGAVRRDGTTILRLRVADREFGADFGVGIGAIQCIDTAVVRPGVTVLVVAEGRAGAQFCVILLIAYPAAGGDHSAAYPTDILLDPRSSV